MTLGDRSVAPFDRVALEYWAAQLPPPSASRPPASTAPPPALAELMAGWYEVSPTQPDPAWTPPSWSAPTDRLVYQQLVAPSCRGCHASRDDLLDLADPALVRERAALVAQVVCRPDTVPHGMPNAEVTLASFWAGAGRAYLATLVGPELAGACTAR